MNVELHDSEEYNQSFVQQRQRIDAERAATKQAQDAGGGHCEVDDDSEGEESEEEGKEGDSGVTEGEGEANSASKFHALEAAQCGEVERPLVGGTPLAIGQEDSEFSGGQPGAQDASCRQCQRFL